MTITIEQFNAIKKLSRMGTGARAQCAKLVLVDGLTPTEAARQVGTTPQTAHTAVRAVTATLNEARIAAGALKKPVTKTGEVPLGVWLVWHR